MVFLGARAAGGHAGHPKPGMPGEAHLTSAVEDTKYNREQSYSWATRKGGVMLYCPECETSLDVEEDEVDEGEVLSCPECGMDFEVTTINPVELKPVDEEEEYVDEEEEETEDGDYS